MYNFIIWRLYALLCAHHPKSISFCHHIFYPLYLLCPLPSPHRLWSSPFCCLYLRICFLFVCFVCPFVHPLLTAMACSQNLSVMKRSLLQQCSCLGVCVWAWFSKVVGGSKEAEMFCIYLRQGGEKSNRERNVCIIQLSECEVEGQRRSRMFHQEITLREEI